MPGDVPQPAQRSNDRKLRADVFDVPANTGKSQAIFDFWPVWRRGLRAEGNVARRDIMSGRALRTRLLAADEKAEPGITASKVRIGAQEQQMVRAQAVANIGSWLSNRRNDVRDAITAQFTPSHWGKPARRRFQALPPDRREKIEADLTLLRHELNAINIQKAWMVEPGIAVMRNDDATGGLIVVSDRARRLARTIFQGIAFRHRWPRFRSLAMRLDGRAGAGDAWLEPAEPGSPFAWWLNVQPTGVKTPVALPIRGWGREGSNPDGVFGDRSTGALRAGTLGKTVNLFVGDDGCLKAALTRDVTEVFEETRVAYVPLTDVLALDFGLNSLFASNHGDLVGRNFKAKIQPVAERANAEARRMQKLGRKPRDSALYQSLVQRLRGMIDTEINRALNALVARHRPRVLAVELLDFREMKLGRRMNRLLTNCGRGAVAKKLADLHDRLGIEIHEVEPAYTSKTCSCCGYVDDRQRNGEKFRCRFCGTRMHADVNGARNIAASVSGGVSGPAVEPGTDNGDGCSATPGRSRTVSRRKRKRKASSSPRTRSFVLKDIVRRFDARMANLVSVSKLKRGKSGTRESAPDPRLTNPYWKRHSLLIGKSVDGRNITATAFAVDT